MSGFIDDNFIADRSDEHARMEANVFMRQHVVMSDDELADFLKDGAIQDSGQLGAFDVLYGFDSEARDFIVFKQPDSDGPHVVLVQDGRPQ